MRRPTVHAERRHATPFRRPDRRLRCGSRPLRAIWLLLTMALLWAAAAGCSDGDDDGDVVGTVRNLVTGQPLGNVLVKVSHRSARTDGAGEYGVYNLSRDSYTLRVSHPGYDSYTAQVSVTTGPTTHDVNLSPAGSGPSVALAVTPSRVVVNQPVVFTATAQANFAGGSIARYQWDFDGNGRWDLDTTALTSPGHTYTSGGEVRVLLRVTDNRGGAAEAFLDLEVELPDGLSVTARATPTSARVGEPVAFSAIVDAGSSGRRALRYLWDFVGGTTPEYDSNETGDTTYTFTQPGVYNATLAVYDDLGAPVTARVIVTVAAAGALTVELVGSPSSVLAGDRVDFTASAATGSAGVTIRTYRLDFDGNRTWDVSGPANAGQFTYRTAGAYEAKVEVTDSSGRTATDTFVVAVAPLGPLTVDLQNLSSNSTEVSLVQFRAVADTGFVGGTITRYQFDFDGNSRWDLDGTAAQGSHRYGLVGDYQARVVVTDSRGRTAEDTVAVAINPANPPTVDLAAGAATPLVNQTVDFTAPADAGFVGGSITRWQWDFDGNGRWDVTNASPSASHVYPTPGSFTALVQVTDNRGRTATDTVAITARPRQGDIGIIVN